MANRIDEVEIPIEVRKKVLLGNLAQGAGYMSALTIGLVMAKVSRPNIATMIAVLTSVEIVADVYFACDDTIVREESEVEGFGTPQQYLEKAGLGLGLGFAAVGAAFLATKLLKKKDTSDG